ncbi:ATP-binding protein [Mesorhizobium sp. M8A.F.Ca.ET.208.01.1.1]|uniref:AlbA family DNA-binding domain-containing protein n=1 Tax=unclassified Mesorhizobium TaxID=325217 RepID=UPI0010936265|nr:MULTISPECIES: ATP-binding protein [unclassified Mesorhizobium]TGQ86292.1 ATP-binding protein [Mesorhizobium sp. M8A.F.Ca.ET.208.01.1.1]TGT47828.1 ATP-binding protein [Mesorhizobium sp. M8A.F.Ca.ET.167.01.1.1]
MKLLSIDDLESLVALEAREDVHLEFKRSAFVIERKSNDLSKEICAFANSDGGAIVIGIEEGKSGVAVAIDDGVPSDFRAREWIDQVVGSHIQPELRGVAVRELLYKSNMIYVIDIPKSLMAPHQSHDKKYYKRFGSLSVPMEDYEISDIRSRSLRSIAPLEISIVLRGFLFHIAINNTSNSDISMLEIEADSNFSDLLKRRGLDRKSLKLLKRGSGAEYVLASGPELFSDTRTPRLSLSFSYASLGESFFGREDFQLSDYEGQVIVRSQEEEYLKKIADSLDRIEKNQSSFIREFQRLSDFFDGSGINLSLRSLEFLKGKALRKYDPSSMDVGGFSEILCVDRQTATSLYRAFQYLDDEEINKTLDGLDTATQEAFKFYFYHKRSSTD